jgi:uncharacterized protein
MWTVPETARPIILEMVRRIVDGFAPDRVILFGSHAAGQAGPDSDVDLLVVLPCPGSTRQRVVEIRQALADLPLPKDVIVVTPEYFKRHRDIVGTVVWPAVREGELLYERPS